MKYVKGLANILELGIVIAFLYVVITEVDKHLTCIDFFGKFCVWH